MKTSGSQDTTLPFQALELKLAHSPDSDDAFMFYALATRKIPTGKLRFEHVLQDIETLNQKALDGVYDITAVSLPAAPSPPPPSRPPAPPPHLSHFTPDH